jgi:hypothetical protein
VPLFEDDVGHVRQVVVEQLRQVFRPQPFRDAGEPLQVGEENRQLAFFAAELELPGSRMTAR